MTESVELPRDASHSKRIALLVLLVVASVIVYIDRAAISTAKESIQQQFHLDERQMGVVFSVFAIGYAIGQLPAGWLADRIGPRKTLAMALSVWSVLSALTGLIWNWSSLITVRLLLGLGEAAVFPGCARAIRDWLPPSERGRANGALFAGSRLGAALSYPVMALVLLHWNWRRGFWGLGLIGMAWVVLWGICIFSRSALANVSNTEMDVTDYGEHRVKGASPNLLLLSALLFQYLVSNFTNFICLSWMLPYLKGTYGLSGVTASIYSMPPLLCGATALTITGWIVDRLYRSGFARWSRRAPAIVGFALSAIGIFSLTRTHSVYGAVLCFTIAIFGADVTVGPSWVVCTDIGGTKTGRISAIMNLLGGVGAFLSANAYPILHQLTGGYSSYFIVAAVLDLLAIGCWIAVSSLRVADVNQPIAA